MSNVFTNSITGQFTITGEGEYYCGEQQPGKEATFDIEVEVEADELDYRGFVIDVRRVSEYFEYSLAGQREESGEQLAQLTADDLWDDRFTKLRVSIKSTNSAVISYVKTRDDDTDEDDDEDPVERLDRDDAAAFNGGLPPMLRQLFRAWPPSFEREGIREIDLGGGIRAVSIPAGMLSRPQPTPPALPEPLPVDQRPVTFGELRELLEIVARQR